MVRAARDVLAGASDRVPVFDDMSLMFCCQFCIFWARIGRFWAGLNFAQGKVLFPTSLFI
jgi:hypothetical protein